MVVVSLDDPIERHRIAFAGNARSLPAPVFRLCFFDDEITLGNNGGDYVEADREFSRRSRGK